MSLPVTVTFMLADWIAKGLADGTFERVGGVIRDVGTKQVVSWLREQGSNNSQVPTPTDTCGGSPVVATGATQRNKEERFFRQFFEYFFIWNSLTQ